MPTYAWKSAAEAGWYVAVAVATVLLTALVSFDAETVTDWRTWAVGLGSASVRAGAGALLAHVINPVRPTTQERQDERVTKLAEEIQHTVDTPVKPAP